MKRIANINILLVLLLAFASCEKVIDVRLNDVAKKYVVEANISNDASGCTVAITQTKNFSENNDFAGVSGAIVTISDNGAAVVTLTETSQGNYTTSAINGTTGHVYALHIQVGGQSFTASSTMPAAVNLDSAYIEDRIFFGDSTKTVNVQYQDPPAMGNAYHFIQYRNNVREKTVFVNNDDYTNGNTVTAQLFTFNNDDDDKKIKSGDTVRVIMECIDTPVYNYWFSLDAATGESNNATPANPVSNITGGALGYFSAHTTQSKTFLVP